jgi:hypothetical protein
MTTVNYLICKCDHHYNGDFPFLNDVQMKHLGSKAASL